MSEMSDFKGQVCLVTAAGSGIGLAHARQLARRGAKVAMLDLNGDAVRQAADAIGTQATAHEVDATDPAAVRAVVDRVLSDEGRIDALTNSVGYYSEVPFDAMDVTEWRRTMDVNVISAFLCSQAVVPSMRAKGNGSIIMVASGAGLRARIPLHYSVAKAAVVQLGKTMALLLGKDKIRVNVVAPGNTVTPMTSFLEQDTARRDALEKLLPLGRLAQPDEIAEVLTFVHSPAAGYMSGSIVSVDGGSTLI